MGQGSQSGMDGQHPAWSQMARMGGVASPLEMLQAQDAFRADRSDPAARAQFRELRNGPQLPDPMQQAREHFINARENFAPARQEFQSLQGAEKRAARPEFQQDRNEFQVARDWYRDLQGMTDGQAMGTAAFGPPRMNEGPQFAPMMEVPQFPGMGQHDGTVQGLLGVLQKQTAKQTFGGAGKKQKSGGVSQEAILEEIQRQNRLATRGITPRDTVAIHEPGGGPGGWGR